MARKKRGRRRYATDLTDGQWALIAPLIPEAEPGGRPRKASARTLVDAILYFLRGSNRRFARAADRGREASPAAILDSQSVKTPIKKGLEGL